MPPAQIRRFQRSDRDQLTQLVNDHVAAVVPGVTVSVNTVMSQLEREPAETIVDPWVIDRRTLVAVQQDAIVGGAHLLRYAADERVSGSYRDSAEIRWTVCAVHATAAGDALVAAGLELMDGWGVQRQHADGSLPALACYGVPDCWPHIADLYARAGFVHDGSVEVILVAKVDDLPSSTPAGGRSLRRSVGVCGTRFTALQDGAVVGVIEVEADLTGGGARSRLSGWSDIGNLHVAERHRRQGVGTQLLAAAAGWLALGGAQRLVAYAAPDAHDELAFLHGAGFAELTRTRRGWVRGAVS